MFHRYINYKWQFSIAMLNYQRVDGNVLGITGAFVLKSLKLRSPVNLLHNGLRCECHQCQGATGQSCFVGNFSTKNGELTKKDGGFFSNLRGYNALFPQWN